METSAGFFTAARRVCFCANSNAFEFEVTVEVALDSGLGGVGNHDDLVKPGCKRFFYDVVDDGMIDQREHLLGDGLGGREKPCAVARGEDDGLADVHTAARKFMALLRA